VPTPNPATLAGFQAWANTNGISFTILPQDSPFWGWAFNVAVDIVSPRFLQVSCDIYVLMVYNLAGSNLLNFAQDPPDAPQYKNGKPYFEYMREKYNILGPVSGVVQSAGDQGTSAGLEVPQALKDLTLADLQYLKDPFGRVYLQFAQRQGSLWGLS